MATNLATHTPVVWCIKWQWDEFIDVVQTQKNAGLATITGPGRRRDPKHTAELAAVTRKADELKQEWGLRCPTTGAGPAEGLIADLAEFRGLCQEMARKEGHFLTGSISRDLGKPLTYEQVQPASLVLGKEAASRSFFGALPRSGASGVCKRPPKAGSLRVTDGGENGWPGSTRGSRATAFALSTRMNLSMCGQHGRITRSWLLGPERP